MPQGIHQAVLPRSIGPIEEPSSNDVLCGRGGDVNGHIGNLRMRGFGVDVRDVYKQAKKSQKRKIAARIVQKVQSVGGRFLKRDKDTGLWWEVGDEQAITKVSQALRESVPDKEGWQSIPSGFVDSLLPPSVQQTTLHLPSQQAERASLEVSEQGLHLLSEVSMGSDTLASSIKSGQENGLMKYQKLPTRLRS